MSAQRTGPQDRPQTIEQLARFAINGWAIYAKSAMERDEIHRLHSELDALLAAPVSPAPAVPREGPTPMSRDPQTPQIEAGAVFVVPYPFVLRKHLNIDGDYPWQPGTENVMVEPDDSEAVADDLGSMTLTVVSVHKPGKFPTRVFYTRTFTDPDGHTFGRAGCRMTTLEKFRRISTKFQYDFRMRKLA